MGVPITEAVMPVRVCWHQKVCRKGFCSLLGIGRQRLTRVSKTMRGKDGRSTGG